MIKIDLITGFLGAGKTTFMKKYARYLIGQGHHIGIIENDFGAINIDMLLLQDLESELCEIEPIVGGNVVTDWKRRFKAKLILFSMQGVERVLVEPSGIYDVDSFLEVLYDETICGKYEIGNIFTLVDAKLDERLSEQSEYLLVSQLANCGQVIMSKVNDVTEDDKKKTVDHLIQLLKRYHCEQDISNKIFLKNWDELQEDDFEKLINCGWVRGSFENAPFDKNEVFSSLFFMHVHIEEEKLEEKFNSLIHDELYGTIFRIKGFFPAKTGKWIEVNATREHFEMKTMEYGQEVVIIIGENLQEEAINKALNEV